MITLPTNFRSPPSSDNWKLRATPWGQLRELDAALFAKIPDGDLVVAFRNVLARGSATLDHRRVYQIASTRAGAILKALAGAIGAISGALNGSRE